MIRLGRKPLRGRGVSETPSSAYLTVERREEPSTQNPRALLLRASPQARFLPWRAAEHPHLPHTGEGWRRQPSLANAQLSDDLLVLERGRQGERFIERDFRLESHTKGLKVVRMRRSGT